MRETLARLISEQAFCDPISGTAILVTLAISAGLSAGSYFLSRLLTPKPQGRTQGKLYGELQVSDSSWNVFIPELYGARPSATEQQGGVRLGVNHVWATDIREHRTTVPGSGTGGRKGAPEPPPDVRITYDLDFASLVGRGPLRILQIKANEDILYNGLTTILPTGGSGYEAEDGTLSGGATATADGECSNGFKVTGVGNGGTVLITGIEGYGRHPIEIFYKSTTDTQLYISVNGGAASLYIFPDSNGSVASKLIIRNLQFSITNTIEFSNPSASGPDLDVIVIHEPIDDPRDIGPIGNLDSSFPNEATYDHFMLPDPKEEDTNAWERYNRVVVDEVDGSQNITLANGAHCTIYEGNETQMPDPLISADIDTRFGANSTPAYRGRCYLVFQNFDITKYGSMPNITVIAEHKTLKTMREILEHRAQRAGVQLSDVDFSACDAVKVRGFAVNKVQAVSQDMDELGKVFNYGFIEDFDGVIKAKDLSSRTLVATLSESDLGAREYGAEQVKSLVETSIPEITELPQKYTVGFFNPEKDFQSDEREDQNENTHSVKVETETFQITLLPDEATRLAQRLLQKAYHESDPHTISLQHRFAYLQAADRIKIPIDGDLKAVRIKEITGAIPGVLKVSVVNDDLVVFAGSPLQGLRNPKRYPLSVAANSVVTFCDIPRLRENDNVPGIYVFATPRDLVNGVWQGATLFRDKGEGYRQMAVFDAPCTMGRTVDTLGDVPGGWVSGDWDDTNTVTIDLFYGTLGSSADDKVLDGANLFIIGDEVIGAVNCVRDSSYPNRWTLSRLQRRLKKTVADTHATGERACFLNSAARFVALDLSEVGVARNYKCVTHRQSITHVAVVPFTWGGTTQTSMPAYDVIDSDVPTVTDPPEIRRNDQFHVAEWTIYIPRPSDYGFTADNVEIRFTDRNDSQVVRQLQIGNTTFIRQPMFAFDCDVDYRWRNRYRENGSNGWSSWSTSAIAYGLNSSATTQNPPDSELVSFENDSSDVSKASTRKTLY